ncbi:TPA: GntR family transcriptional regulator [Streptococcus suis]
MTQTIDNSKPIFQQIKEQIEDMIMNDTISETGRVPSTKEFAKYHKINPATAAKGINQLVEEGIKNVVFML